MCYYYWYYLLLARAGVGNFFDVKDHRIKIFFFHGRQSNHTLFHPRRKRAVPSNWVCYRSPYRFGTVIWRYAYKQSYTVINIASKLCRRKWKIPVSILVGFLNSKNVFRVQVVTCDFRRRYFSTSSMWELAEFPGVLSLNNAKKKRLKYSWM